MADTKRQKLISAIVERMRTILTTNGYETDLGANVADWETNWQQNELPALSVCDTVADVSLPDDNVNAPSQQHVLPVMLRIFAKSNTRAATLREMMGDVVAAIGTDIYWTDGDGKKLAIHTKVRKAGIIVPEENFEIGGAGIEIEIAYLVGRFEF